MIESVEQIKALKEGKRKLRCKQKSTLATLNNPTTFFYIINKTFNL